MGNITMASNEQLGPPLDDVPDDVLFEILLRVPTKSLMQSCVCTCQRWKNIILSEAFWRRKCIYDHVYSSDVLYLLADEKARDLYMKRPYSYNLIKNHDARKELQHWHVVNNGGNGWQTEERPIGSDAIEDYCTDLSRSGTPTGCFATSGCWATSYGHCAKEQVIDLLKAGCSESVLDNIRPPIKVSEWYAARFDCGIEYGLRVTLRRQPQGGEIDTWEFSDIKPPGRCWFKTEHTFVDYGAGVRYICFHHYGKDTQFWAGHYGSKISLSSVVLDLNDVATQPKE